MNSSGGRWSRRDTLLVLLLGGLVALFFWRILTPNPADRAQFLPGDFTDQFYAFRLYEARAFASGRLPLWSENFNSGHPFLADVQSAVFYPPGLANTLLNVALFGPSFSLWALELEALLHFWLAAGFTYLFARRIMPGRAGPFAAAVTFGFGGYLTSYPPLQLAILETAAWLPLTLYFLDCAAVETNRHVPFLLAAGLTLAVAALAGHPQTFFFIVVTGALYWLYRAGRWEHNLSWKDRLAPLAPLALALVVPLGAAAVQLVPSFEYQRLSTRTALSFREAAVGFPTLDVLQFIFPGFTSMFASPLYVGVLPLWLALLALTRRTRERAFWGALALAALVLSFGFYVFGYALLYQLPGLGLFRDQERLAFLVSFGLALLAGFGLQDLLDLISQGGSRRVRKLLLLLPAGAVTSFALLLVFFVGGVEQPSGRLAGLGDRAGLMLLLFLLGSALIALCVAGRITARALVPLAIGLILFDLWSVNEPANKAAPQPPYGQNAAVDTVRADEGMYRVAGEGQDLPGHWGIGYGLEDIGGISPLRLAAYDELLSLDSEIAWQLLNVKYVYTTRPGLVKADRLRRDGEMALWELQHPAPRAWLVGQAESNLSDSRTLEMLRGGADPARLALLAGQAPFALSDAASGSVVNIVLHEPERLVIQVQAQADGLLVVSENYYPGWAARVDGVPTEILRADLSLRAIPVRAGPHRVEIIYDPLSLKLGAALSLLTLLSCAAVLFRFRAAAGQLTGFERSVG